MMAHSGISLALLAIFLLAAIHHVTGTFPRLCGQELVSAVGDVCRDRGYYVQPSKRSVSGAFQAEALAKSFLKTMGLSSGGQSRVKRRVRTGRIVTECCLNSCSYSILESYCNPWPEGTVDTDESVHARGGKSAEDEIILELQGRPLEESDGPSQVDREPLGDIGITEAAVNAKAKTRGGRNRLERVEDTLSGEGRSKSTPQSSKSTSAPSKSPSSSPGKKPRKDKNARRKSSREAKEARREQRRRNKERASAMRASGGRSRGGSRKKNRASAAVVKPTQALRVKRHGRLAWSDIISQKETASFEKTTVVHSGLAPPTFTGDTFARHGPSDLGIVRISDLFRPNRKSWQPKEAAEFRPQISRNSDFHLVMDKLRTFLTQTVDRRKR